jgi:putative ABC transport system ATP-binding protein
MSTPPATGTRVSTPIVAVDDVVKEYGGGAHTVRALDGIGFSIDHGQLVAVRGRSGSGKTTLLNMIGGLDQPTSGSVSIQGVDITSTSEDELVRVRRHTIGYIFQSFGLIPVLTAAENVEVPLRLLRTDPAERAERSRVLLELVGLGDRAKHRPHELSGGEQQRVAIARSLANRPSLLLADEPTGQLDSHTSRAIMNVLLSLARSEDVAVVVATHEPALIDLADRVLEISDGRIIADSGADFAPPRSQGADQSP